MSPHHPNHHRENSIPEGDEGVVLSRIDWREFPHVRKVGRYAFFALCAWGCSLTAGFVVKGLGGVDQAVEITSTVAAIIVFLTLRDMSAAWDFALREQAKSLADAQPTPGKSPPHSTRGTR